MAPKRHFEQTRASDIYLVSDTPYPHFHFEARTPKGQVPHSSETNFPFLVPYHGVVHHAGLMDALIRAHIQKVVDALLSSGSYEGSLLDTLSEQHKELQAKYSQLQLDHQALQQKYDTKIAGFEAANKWLGEELMEMAGKHNELAKQLKGA